MEKSPPTKQPTFSPTNNTNIVNSQRNNQDSTTIFMPLYNTPKKNQKTNKCLVYFFTIFVVVCLSLVIFASVLKPKHPNLKIDKLIIKSLKYDTSQPSFNISTHMIISLENNNFGHFEFDHTNKDNMTMMSLHYRNGTVVGSSKLKFRAGRVASRSEEEVVIDVMMLSTSKNNLTMDENNKLKRDLNSGVLEFMGYATLSGKVHLLKKFRFHSKAFMNCDIAIDLTRKENQRLLC